MLARGAGAILLQFFFRSSVRAKTTEKEPYFFFPDSAPREGIFLSFFPLISFAQGVLLEEKELQAEERCTNVGKKKRASRLIGAVLSLLFLCLFLLSLRWCFKEERETKQTERTRTTPLFCSLLRSS